MSIRAFLLVLVLLSLKMRAQTPLSQKLTEAPNATMRAVLMANRPTRITFDEWLCMMAKPVNRTLFPLRVAQEMLDTPDVKAMDVRFHYEIIPVPKSK